MTPYVYVFIRKDIPIENMIVQACHSCLDLAKVPKNTHLVLIGVRNEKAITETSQFLDSKGVKHQMFFEPDFSLGFTSIATEPVYGNSRRKFSKFKLLKF